MQNDIIHPGSLFAWNKENKHGIVDASMLGIPAGGEYPANFRILSKKTGKWVRWFRKYPYSFMTCGTVVYLPETGNARVDGWEIRVLNT